MTSGYVDFVLPITESNKRDEKWLLTTMNFGCKRGQQSSRASINLDEVVDKVLVMRHQEETSYCYRSFLPRLPDGSRDTGLNISWREKICQWSYRVVDHFDLPREVVAVSLCLFDRYLATRGNDCNGNLALLTSLTTLHIAIKLNDSTKKIKLSTLANLSRGQFGPKHIEKMEWEILKTLEWKLHPPTQSTFVSHLLLFLPPEVNPAARKSLTDLSKYLTELAVCDSYFVDINNSVVAFAAILNVLEDMNYARFSGGLREKFLNTIACQVGFIYNSPDVVCARHRLRKIFASSSMMDNVAGQSAAQQQQFQHENNNIQPPSHDQHQHHVESDVSLADRTMGSAGSVGSLNTVPKTSRSRANSFDSSKGSCRGFSPSTRRPFVASVSPMTSRAARISSSPIVAGLQ